MSKRTEAIAAEFSRAAKSAIDLGGVETGRKVRIGIVGCGRIGRTHAATIAGKLANAELVCVSDFIAEAARACAAAYGVPMACRDHVDLLEHGGVDAVVICSPTDTHAQIIKDCARRGKHVFCEKPIDKDVKVIKEAVDEAEKAGIKLMVGFQRRFCKNFIKVRDARASGELGTPVKVSLISRDPSPPPLQYLQESGGVFLDQTIHDFDMARFLVGSDIVEITAMGVALDKKIAELGDYDHTLCYLKFANGCMGTIDNSRATTYGYDQRAELFGTKGAMRVTNEHLTETLTQDAIGTRRDNPKPFFMERYADSYMVEMATFVDCILNDKAVPCGGSDGLIPVLYAMAAAKSAKENRPVKISEIERVLED